MSDTPGTIRVLHVDDEPDFAEMAATFLEREREELAVAAATGADEGLERLADGDFDCVVSDYDMPGLNGIEFLEAVREEHPELPFVLFTGKGSEGVASEAISAGVTDYLRKESGTDQYAILANRIVNAVEASRSRRRATHQERINTLIRRLNRRLVAADTIDAIERTVCETITDSEPYRFAWIGEPDPDAGTIVPRASAGDAATYLDEVTVRYDGDDPEGQGPGGRAVRTREPQIAEDISEDPSFEPWRETAETYGFESVIVLPLVRDDALHGILAIYADRSDAFDETEREVLAELAKTIGEALTATRARHRLQQRERAIEELHSAARRVLRVDTREGVAEVVVEALRDTLRLPLNAVWLHDPEENTLRAAACSDRAAEVVGENPTFGPGDGLVWQAFETGESKYYDDVSGVPGCLNPDTDIRSEIIVPLGEHGALTISSTRADAFDEVDVSLAETLASYATTALDRIDREGTLQRERDRFRAIFEESFDAMVIADDDGRYVDANDSAVELFGLPGDELLGRSIAEFAPEEFDFEAAWEAFRTSGEERGEFPLVRPDGTERVVEFGATANIAPGQHLSVLRDVTDRREREEELRDTLARLEALFENSPDMINVHDADGNLLDPNPQLCEQTGYDEDELADMKVWDLDRAIDPDEVRAMWGEMEPGDKRKLEGSYRRRDGSTFPVEVHVRRLDLEGEDRFLAISRDVTERKRREEELRRQNERLAEFASVVSHDLRNPLNVAQGRLELARAECDGDHLDEVARAHDRMEALIEDILTLARQDDRVDDPEAVDLADAVERCWRNVATEGATLAVRTERTIRADPGRLQRLLENLVRNAIEHGSTGSRAESDDDAERGDVTVTVGDLPDGEGFYVADDGPGIPADERERVFESGYSTAEEGTGFGLAIVADIAEAHGWTVDATESEDGGTRFEIAGVAGADGADADR